MFADRISKDGRGHSRTTRVMRAASGHCSAAVGIDFGVFTPRFVGVCTEVCAQEDCRHIAGTMEAQKCFGLCRATCVQRSDPTLPVAHAGGCAAGRRRPGGARRQRARQQPARGHVAAAAGYVDAMTRRRQQHCHIDDGFPSAPTANRWHVYVPTSEAPTPDGERQQLCGLPSLGLQQHCYAVQVDCKLHCWHAWWSLILHALVCHVLGRSTAGI